MTREYTTLFPFCGLGAGALGFLQAQHEGTSFRSLGGIDFDPIACADFERLTGSPAWCADLLQVKPQDLRDRYGERAPDVVFLSPPCKGASGLLSKGAAASDKYKQMNELAYVWTVLMLAAWPIHRPRLVLLENVPRLPTRAAAMLGRVRELLQEAGYEISEGFHDCGVLGGLAQHRRRFLLVARLRQTTEHLLYEPPVKRVLGCGEVLSQLPIPLPDQETSAGPMHRLPRLSWLNWVRLSLIPAGGDWRDLPGVLEEGQRRGEVWKRHRVEAWEEPVGTVAGSGSNGVANVADPRVELPGLSSNPSRHHNKYQPRLRGLRRR